MDRATKDFYEKLATETLSAKYIKEFSEEQVRLWKSKGLLNKLLKRKGEQ